MENSLEECSSLIEPKPVKAVVIPNEVTWVPCMPDVSSGGFIPLYNLMNFPNFSSSRKTVHVAIGRGGLKNKVWCEREDNLLRDLVTELGSKAWLLISKRINDQLHEGKPVRKGKNCRERWLNHLNPQLNSKFYIEGEWTYQEDAVLLREILKNGRKWSKISKILAGRTENSVKNRFNSIFSKARATIGSQFVPDATIILMLLQQLEQQIAEV